jgi:signal transduction histidine kinase
VIALPARHRALLLDLGVAVGLAVAIVVLISARQESGAKDPDALAYTLGVAVAASSVARRRWPLPVFNVSVLLLIAYHALDYPAVGLALPLSAALYAAAGAGHVRAVVAVFVGLELWALGWRAVGEHQSLVEAVGAQTLFETSFVAAVLLLAEAVSSRRAWRAGVAERLRMMDVAREREADRRVEQERLRIAREMHDVLAHTIAVIGVQADVAQEALADAPEEAEASLRTIRAKSREAMTEVRATLGVLREARGEASPAPTPGLSQLPELVGVAAGAELRVEPRVVGAVRPLPSVVDLTASRIVQESLTNVLRHARARVAKVSIGYRPDGISLEIEDDGAIAPNGFASLRDGHGLAGMRERVASLLGRFEAGPANGAGFRVRAWLPTERVPS